MTKPRKDVLLDELIKRARRLLGTQGKAFSKSRQQRRGRNSCSGCSCPGCPSKKSIQPVTGTHYSSNGLEVRHTEPTFRDKTIDRLSVKFNGRTIYDTAPTQHAMARGEPHVADYEVVYQTVKTMRSMMILDDLVHSVGSP